jgi:hypothetical protein
MLGSRISTGYCHMIETILKCSGPTAAMGFQKAGME